MTTRRRKSGGTAWWVVAAVIVVVAFVLWWFSAQRVEAPAPPAIKGMDPSIVAPADHPDHEHGEITHEEKESLERIIQERGAASPK